MTFPSSGISALDALAGSVPPGRAVLDDVELAALAAATGRLLEVERDAGRAEYLRFRETAGRGITVNAPALDRLHRGATVVVTGGTGCIGSAVIRELLDLGPARIISVSRGLETGWPRFDGVDYLELDVRDGRALGELIGALRPDVVYHLAAQHDPGLAEVEVHRTLSTNVTGTANLIAACRAVPGVRLACASTGKALRPFTRDVYSASKKMMEALLARAAEDDAVTISAVRFTHVVDNSIIERRLHAWCADDRPIRLHSLDTMFYTQSAREAAQLLMSSVLEADAGMLSLAAIRDLGWPVSLLQLALGVLDSGPTRSVLYPCGFEMGYEKAPYPGLYDPMASGSVSPLFNAFEAFGVQSGRNSPDLDVYRTAATTSASAVSVIEQVCRDAGAGRPVDGLRSQIDACGWAMWRHTVSSLPLAVLQRHAALAASKPLASFSRDDRRVRSMVEREVLHRPDRTGLPSTAASSPVHRAVSRSSA